MTIHPTAHIEPEVTVGKGTRIWEHVHLRRGAIVGEDCIVGEKTIISGEARVGNRVKIGALVFIPPFVTVEDGAMIGAGTLFSNDPYPRATTPDLTTLRPSEPHEGFRKTLVREGATIGIGCRILGGVTIGRFAMVGLGSVVTKSVADFQLVVGHPARRQGFVSRCGHPLNRLGESGSEQCAGCGRVYALDVGTVVEKPAP